MRKALETAGFHTEALTYDWKRTIEEGGSSLDRWLAPKVFRSSRVVAHSMGGLVTRWCVEQLAAPDQRRPVSEIVTLGTLHHGTPLANRGVELVKAFAAWLLARTQIPGLDQLAEPLAEAALRKWAPFILDFEPGSDRLNLLNYGPGYTGDGEKFCKGPQDLPAHPEEALPSYVRYVTFAGDKPQGLRIVGGILLEPCASDGAVPVHSARLYNTSSNVSNFLVSCFSPNDPQCQVSHEPQRAGDPPQYESDSEINLKSSTCVQSHVVAALRGNVEPCPATLTAAPLSSLAAGDSLLTALTSFDHLLAPGALATDTVAVPAGTEFMVFASWRQDGLVLELQPPAGALIDSAACVGVPGRAFLSDPTSAWSQIDITGAAGGNWIVRVRSVADSSQRVSVKPFLRSTVTLAALTTPAVVTPNTTVRVMATLRRAGAPITGAAVSTTMTSQSTAEFIHLVDDGSSGDVTANDGVYTALFKPTSAGTYSAKIRAVGGSGLPYGTREAWTGLDAELGVDIALPYASLTSPSTWAYPNDPLPFSFRVRNDGDLRADSVWVYAYDESARVAFADTVVSIGAKDSMTFTRTFRAAQIGRHQLRFSARSLVGPVDVQRSNSRASRPVEIVAFGGTPVVGIPPAPIPIPHDGRLFSRVVPTPADRSATIEFELPRAVRDARILVVDAAGRRISRRSLGRLDAGWHRVPWQAASERTAWSSAVLFYRIQADDLIATGRIVTIR
jgi:hypothetical protein